MKNRSGNAFVALALLALFTLNVQPSTAQAQGTAFTYQGQLQDNGGPASGIYNLQFSLYDATTSGTAIAGPVTTNGVLVTNGLFTVTIDFGSSAWNGQTNWLQIGVETNGVSSFTTLSPRQRLTPVPYAIYAETASAGGISGTISGGNIGGTYDNAVAFGNGADTFEGTFSGQFIGNGNALTNLNASQLTSIGNNDGFDNFFVGPSGNSTMSGFQNTGIGQAALSSNLQGYENTADGFWALKNNTNGAENTAIGSGALYLNTSGFENTAVGVGALYLSPSDNGLVAVGFQALLNDNASYTGSFSGNGENTAIGWNALESDTNGYANTAIGYQALQFNVSGSYNTAVGDYALQYNTNGSQNTVMGYAAFYDNTGGSFNTVNGAFALYGNTSGDFNTAIGYTALNDNTNGAYNTAVGVDALYNNTSGANNIALGFDAGVNLNTGSYDIYIGGPAGSANENDTIRIGTPGVQTNSFIAGVVNVSTLSVNTGAGTLTVDDDNGFTPGIMAAGGPNPGHMRYRNWVEIWPNTASTAGGTLDVRNTNGNPTITLTGATGSIACTNVIANGVQLTSDRNAKEDFTPVSATQILARVAALPITEWNYKFDNKSVQHLGPMAQDFQAAFRLDGNDDKHISVIDEGGVALAAIQGLNQKLEEQDKEKDSEIQQLQQDVSELKAMVSQLAQKRRAN